MFGWTFARRYVIICTMAFAEYQTLKGDVSRLVIAGRLDAEAVSSLWTDVLAKITKDHAKTLEVEAGDVEYCDGAGIGLLLEIQARQRAAGGEFRISGLNPKFAELMVIFDPGESGEPPVRSRFSVRCIERTGQAVSTFLKDMHRQISFAGEVGCKLLHILVSPRTLRLKATLSIAEKAGANAVGIVGLLGFLIGLILAFQSAVAMQKFGAEIFVSDLVALSLLRELGPLITAFVVASRSGSAFAAELGTMKVNEELDALATMGLDPVRFLVIPRIIATTIVTPLLTMFYNLLGLIGCGVVMMSMGFAPVTILDHIQEAVGMGDLLGGLAKTVVFGALIASIGCLRGLETGSGASAVGESATRAVVSGIVAIIVADGIFAVAFYFLGI